MHPSSRVSSIVAVLDEAKRMGRRLLHLVIAVAALGALTSCASGSVGGTLPAHLQPDTARDRVTELVRAISDERGPDIGTFARAAVEQGVDEGIQLIGIQETAARELVDTFGHLEFLVSPPEDGFLHSDDPEAGPLCFRVAFNHYGMEGDWAGEEGVESVPCPENPSPITPPADETIYAVVASNAEEVASAVLTALPSGPPPPPDEIAAAISATLADPEGEYMVAAPPDVAVDGARVGVAMGNAADCLLLAWSGGVVTRVHVPSVRLQDGELGCAGSTALASAEDLRPPH